MKKYTRRSFLKAGFVTAASSSFITVTRAQISSGQPEITVRSTIRDNTSIEIKVIEELDGTNTNTISLDDGINSYPLENLEGLDTTSDNYTFDISLNSNGENTPEIDFIHLELPSEGDSDGGNGDGDLGPSGDIWETNIILFFVTAFLVLVYMIIGD